MLSHTSNDNDRDIPVDVMHAERLSRMLCLQLWVLRDREREGCLQREVATTLDIRYARSKVYLYSR